MRNWQKDLELCNIVQAFQELSPLIKKIDPLLNEVSEKIKKVVE